MTRARFVAMLEALIAGNHVEIDHLSDGSWVPVRISPTSGNFEIHLSRRGWTPAPIGNIGHKDWRYPTEESYTA